MLSREHLFRSFLGPCYHHPFTRLRCPWCRNGVPMRERFLCPTEHPSGKDRIVFPAATAKSLTIKEEKGVRTSLSEAGLCPRQHCLFFGHLLNVLLLNMSNVSLGRGRPVHIAGDQSDGLKLETNITHNRSECQISLAVGQKDGGGL